MEKYVELQKKKGTLRGMLHIPEGADKNNKVPGVILFHGFTGNRMEPKFIFVRFSRLLSSMGIASVRFDFLNSGESDGSFENMTFSGELEDAEDILNYFSSLDFIDSDNIFLLGLSMGGSIAGCTAGKNSSRIKGLVLWAPAGEMAVYIEAREEEYKNGEAEGDPMDASGLTLGHKFIDDVKKIKVMDITADYKGPTAIFHGTGDESVPVSVSRQYEDILEGETDLTIIENADHTFQGAKWIEELFSKSSDFIKRQTGSYS